MTTSGLLLAALAIVAICAAAAAPSVMVADVVGGWSPIEDINDPHIQELGEWAVSEHNKVSTTSVLTFSKVTSGEQQVVSGMNYRLFIAASTSNDTNGSYVAVVFEQASTRKLVSFSTNCC
uniref:Cystatin domain-containing protein n=1 Tax=Leersia perrieri TaxID=77586 RepID=A0A0D9WYJ1_9ORYZ